MYSLLRSLLFKCDPERAHALALSLLTYVPRSCFRRPHETGPLIRAMGLDFPHPVGLAAGFDKNGASLDALSKLGFSFIEIGTTTPRPQLGNPKPRLFRLPEAQAIINRMGFNNDGVDALVQRVRQTSYRGILGINIGKNKDTPLTSAVDDYLYCLEKVYPYASYVAVNISSPNTPDLRQLQHAGYFGYLMQQLRAAQLRWFEQHRRYVPLLVKVSPDESDESLQRMAEAVVRIGIDGIIATNTTSNHDSVAGLAHAAEQGGLSGQPLLSRSTTCLRVLKSVVGHEATLIGVGGIDSVASAQQKLEAGATLVQLYSGLIYRGPGLVRELLQGLR